jgi:hypothetical protein
MNERIFELAKQTNLIQWDTLPSGARTPDHESVVKAIKFAELIVRECIGCCEQVISDPVPESVDTWLNGGEQCIQEIKQHFGLGMSVADKKQLIKDLMGVQK